MTDLVIYDFKQRFETSGCRVVLTWGLAATQPTYRPGHGRLRDVLTCTVGADRRKSNASTSSYPAQRDPAFHVKAE